MTEGERSLVDEDPIHVGWKPGMSKGMLARTKILQVRITPSGMGRLDHVRGELSRSEFVRRMLMRELNPRDGR